MAALTTWLLTHQRGKRTFFNHFVVKCDIILKVLHNYAVVYVYLSFQDILEAINRILLSNLMKKPLGPVYWTIWTGRSLLKIGLSSWLDAMSRGRVTKNRSVQLTGQYEREMLTLIVCFSLKKT